MWTAPLNAAPARRVDLVLFAPGNCRICFNAIRALCPSLTTRLPNLSPNLGITPYLAQLGPPSLCIVWR